MSVGLRPFDRSAFLVVGAAWFGVGWFGHAPILSDAAWFAVCAVPAGTAVAVARHLSRYALASFVWASLIVAVARSVAYLSDGIKGPLFVWIIVSALVLLVRDRLIREDL